MLQSVLRNNCNSQHRVLNEQAQRVLQYAPVQFNQTSEIAHLNITE